MTSYWRADLHSHSHCSDGTFSVEEMILHAKKIGLQGLSITDHDSIEAYEKGPALADAEGLYLLSGVEFSTTYQGSSIHVLGYAFRLDAPPIKELCQRHIDRRRKRNQAILEKLTKYGIYITQDDLAKIASAYPKATIGRPHIALAMLNQGKISNIKEAFQLYIGDSAPCFVKGDPITTEETIDALHKSGGIAALAHPHLIEDSKLINTLIKLPFDAIETFYGNFTADQNERWTRLAQKHGKMMVGGSDFHGSIKPNILLGSSWTCEETFRPLWERYRSNNPELSLRP